MSRRPTRSSWRRTSGPAIRGNLSRCTCGPGAWSASTAPGDGLSPFPGDRILNDMEAIAKFQGGVRFEVAARGHRAVCDQPAESGGADAGMTPPEFLLGSLATCAGYYAAQYLKGRGLSTDGL